MILKTWEEAKKEPPRLDIPDLVRNGIECPKCKSEMFDITGMVLASNPPQVKAICMNRECDFEGYRFK